MAKIKEKFINKCLRCDVQFISKSKLLRLCEPCKLAIHREGGHGIQWGGRRNASKNY